MINKIIYPSIEKYNKYALALGGRKFFNVIFAKDSENSGNKEKLEYLSNIFYMQQQGIKNFRGVPVDKKLKIKNSPENIDHNYNIFREAGLLGTMDQFRTNFEGKSNRNSFFDEVGRAGIVFPNLFYTSQDLDEKKLYSLLEAKNYSSNGNFGGFKSSWVKDKDGKINYCTYLRDENGYPCFDLKYIAKRRGENEKYDLVARFNKEGIREIKHIEHIQKELSLSPEFKDISLLKDKFRDYIPFTNYFFKTKKESSRIEYCSTDVDGSVAYGILKGNEKQKVVLERILRENPLLAGGAYKRILDFCKENYSDLL